MLNIEMQGKVWSSGRFYLAEIPALDLMTQGTSKENAYEMILDALQLHLEELGVSGFDIQNSYWIDKKSGIFSASIPWNKKIVGFVMKRLRDRSEISQRDLAKILGYASHNSIAAYESGKIQPTLEKFAEIMSGLNVRASLGVLLEKKRA